MPKTATSQTRNIAIPDASQLMPTAANYFHFAWSGGIEVQLIVGYLDPNQAVFSNPTADLKPEALARVFMSIRGFAILKAQLDQAARHLEESGIPLNQIIGDSIAAQDVKQV